MSSSFPGLRPARAFLVLAAALCLCAALPASAQVAPTSVRRITSSVVGGEAVITIEANGPLPAPTIGTVDGPPRIFLDFPGVRTSTSGLARAADSRIVRVRAAINSASPLITRVVLDLTSPQPHRIEQATGRVMIFVGAVTEQRVPSLPPMPAVIDPPAERAAPAPRPTATRSAPPLPPDAAGSPGRTSGRPPATPTSMLDVPAPATPLPPLADAASVVPSPAATATSSPIPLVPPLPDPPPAKPTTAARKGTRTAAAPDAPGGGGSHRPPASLPPTKELERYRSSVSPLLLRLRLQQPLLESLGSLEDQAPGRMQSAMEEFDNLRQELSAVKPPETLKPQHELLMQVTRLGMTAARLSAESVKSRDSAVVRNAASAAAGAVLMLDRACVDLGCPNPPGR